LQAAHAAIARYGADRVALALGTSTSGILSTELAYRERGADGALPAWFDYRATHNTGSLTAFVREALGLRGPALTLSTACSSSAKVFAAAQRMMAAGLADAAIVGGVDSMCLTTLYGFASLQLTAPEPCRPCDAQRQGLSIGEAAAFALPQGRAHLLLQLFHGVAQGRLRQAQGFGGRRERALHVHRAHDGQMGAFEFLHEQNS